MNFNKTEPTSSKINSVPFDVWDSAICDFDKAYRAHLANVVKNIEEGKHFLYANRETLCQVVDFLRKHPEKAMSIANNASEFVRNELSPVCAQKFFEEAWLRRIH